MAAGGVLVGRGYVSIRPEFEGDWSRQVNARASRAGKGGAGAFSKAFGVGLKGIGALAGVAVAANLSSAAAGAAALAPALATAGAAAGALKLGLSGVGDAFKAAFADSTADASAAASATKAVEGAQRGLANAQRALAQARVDAAERVKDAQRGVVDAERDLSDAQREARDVQRDLNGARQEASRALEDMNMRLKESQLDERDAALRLTEAQKELAAARAKPGTTPDELAKLQLAYDKAKLNLQEQRTDTKRLAEDTKKANKAGVEGSQQVLAVKERIADANRNVADKERALGDAQRDVDKARRDGAHQIADAQRAVADAAQAVADAQAAAAAQTSKLDQAMAKLAPNAKSFVNAVRALSPAWTDMRLSVQNSLFKGLDSTVTQLGRTTIPILKRQLTETAGVWNEIAKNAASGIQEMAKSGMLDKILKGATDNLAVFKDTPKQIITAFGQLTVAAQPAFNRLLTQFAGAITSFTDGIAASFTSGGLQDAIDTAFGILQNFGTLLGNVFGVVSQIFKAASDAGGQIVGVLGDVFGEIRAILAGPEMQAQLRQLFASVAQIVGAIVPVIGAVVQAVVPLAAAIAQPIAELAVVLGPVLQQLVAVLGATLMPVLQSLMPVLVQVGTAIVEIVRAVMPLLQPIANLISTVIGALAPALTPVIALTEQLVGVLVGPLTQIVQALTPVLVTVAEVISQLFQALQPLLAPVVLLLGQVAQIIAGVFATALKQLMTALQPLIKVGTQLIQTVFAALAPLLPVIGQAFSMLGDAVVTMLPSLGGFADAGVTLVKAWAPLIPIGVKLVTSVLEALLPILPTIAGAFGVLAGALVQMIGPMAKMVASLVQGLAPILTDLAPVLGDFVSLLAGTLAEVLPPLSTAIGTLVAAFAPLLPVFGQLVGIVLKMAGGVLRQLLPSLFELVQAAVQLALALLPLIPPLAQIITLALKLAVGLLSRLLPPIVKLAAFLVGAFAGALSSAIGWLTSIIKVFASLTSAITTRVGPVFNWLASKVVKPSMSAIGTVIGGVWKYGIKPVFDLLNAAVKAVAAGFDSAQKGIKTAWDKLKAIARAPIQYVVDVVYNHGLRGVWNAIAGAFGAPKLPAFKFASGGVLPGYTPGRDPHKFYSPTGGRLEMSGGEAIMRPEFTRAVGPGFVSYFNHLAKSGGTEGVRRQLAPLLGGNPRTSTDRSLKYADGGIFGWIKSAGSAALGAGSAAWNKIKESASWLKDTLEASARAGVEKVVDPLLRNFPGADTGIGAMVRRIPTRIIDALFGYSKESDKKGGGGLGGPKIQAALRWAKTQAGLFYQWAGDGNPSWDCSGFMSAIESVLRGQKPHRRWATMAFSGKTAPPGWVLNGNSPFRIGITNAGVGHTAGTLGGVNVESRGGDGVVVGKRARGYKDPLFGSWYGFQPGKYDAGGFLQPGFSLAYNGTGKPEPVLTGAQWNAVASGGQTRGLDGMQVSVYVGNEQIRDITRAEVRDSQQKLIAVINAS